MRDTSPPDLKVYQWRGPGREDEPSQAELGVAVAWRLTFLACNSTLALVRRLSS